MRIFFRTFVAFELFFKFMKKFDLTQHSQGSSAITDYPHPGLVKMSFKIHPKW